jgi:CheY-like chemotaxis protein
MARLGGRGAPRLDAPLSLTALAAHTDGRAQSIAKNCIYRFYAADTRLCSIAAVRGYATSRWGRLMVSTVNNRIDKRLQSITVLVVDDNQYMRKVVRNILVSLGVKNILEAPDGTSGLDAIRMFAPDLVILDWEMPLLNGAEVVRIIRAPGVFPVPDVPIIMLTGHVERWRVMEATRLGVNEFLKKPVSGKSLLDRMVTILARPRPMVRLGDYYGPEPRKLMHELMLTGVPGIVPDAEGDEPEEGEDADRAEAELEAAQLRAAEDDSREMFLL